jgi:hypothetical protein
VIQLDKKKMAILATHGFEQSELEVPEGREADPGKAFDDAMVIAAKWSRDRRCRSPRRQQRWGTCRGLLRARPWRLKLRAVARTASAD